MGHSFVCNARLYINTCTGTVHSNIYDIFIKERKQGYRVICNTRAPVHAHVSAQELTKFAERR